MFRGASSPKSSRIIRVRVRRTSESYSVRVGRGLLARAGSLLRPIAPGRTVALVTDRTVARLHGRPVLTSLRRAGFHVVSTELAPGERSKNLDTVRAVVESWAREGISRDAVVVALGGGVVSDVAGFAAATFARGIPWIVFPTTVLAQADAAIGGKVGVNLSSGKNLLGSFHHPRGVFADPDALATLSPRAFRSGLAEVVKMGVIRRPRLLPRLLALADVDRPAAIALLPPIIEECAAAKAWYVERDERDHGIRRELNFGHTVGHALEAEERFHSYQHGEAVSVGMVAALRLSVRHAGLDPRDAEGVVDLLRALGLPTRLRRMPGRRFWDALRRDKKRGRLLPRVVLCPAIGKAEVYELASLTSLRRVVQSLVRRSES